MFKQLLITEFQCNRTFLGLSALSNAACFILLGIQQPETPTFMIWTLISFYIFLSIAASYAGQEKRNRQYMQLPFNANQVFLAGWSFVLIWLVLQVCSWLLFGIVYDEQLDSEALMEIINAGIGTAIVMTIISIAIDLGAFRPAFVRWLYIGFVVSLIALAAGLDLDIGMQRDEEGFHIFPLSILFEGGPQFGIGVMLLSGGLFLNYLVFRNSDSYVG